MIGAVIAVALGFGIFFFTALTHCSMTFPSGMASRASMTADSHYWSITQAAAASLCHYLNSPTRGLWFNEQMPDGTLVDSTVPVNTFYHMVGAIAELDAALRNANPQESTSQWNT